MRSSKTSTRCAAAGLALAGVIVATDTACARGIPPRAAPSPAPAGDARAGRTFIATPVHSEAADAKLPALFAGESSACRPTIR
jgi:hypothetical protein